MDFCESIQGFLSDSGLSSTVGTYDGYKVIYTDASSIVLPVYISSPTPRHAQEEATKIKGTADAITAQTGGYPLIITEDRWKSQQKMMQARLLAHLRIFVQIYARNCEIRKIDKATAAEFLAANHSYGDASCRYRYGLFLKRYTGHTSDLRTARPQVGDLVAVATFSNGRKWVKGDKTIRSYEWTRYASLPGVRLSGGMGRLLKAFIEDVKPDDIMTYADLEWSEGKVYETLGFGLEGQKDPVMFSIDNDTWKRMVVKYHPDSGQHSATDIQSTPSTQRFLQNFGSNKYRLKLTDYQ